MMQPETNDLIEFQHSNLNTSVYVLKTHVWYFYYSENDKCVHVVSNAGAFFPVKENLAQVKEKLLKVGVN